MAYMNKAKLLSIALKGKKAKGSRRSDIDEELEPREETGYDEHDLDHEADGGLHEPDEDEDGHGEPDEDELGGPPDEDEDDEAAGDDEHAVVGDLVQSGLSHEQASAIVDAIRALSGGSGAEGE